MNNNTLGISLFHSLTYSITDRKKSCEKLPNVAKCSQMLLKVAKMFSKVAKSCQKLQKVAKRCQKLPKVAKCCQMLPNDAKQCQMLPKVAKRCQKLQTFKHVTDVRTDRWSSGAAVEAKKPFPQYWFEKCHFFSTGSPRLLVVFAYICIF